MKPAGSWHLTWRRPVQLALLTALGLGSALVGTGAWRWIAWACLSVPIVAAVRALLATTPTRHGSGPLR